MDWSADGVTALNADTEVAVDMDSSESDSGYKYFRLAGHQGVYTSNEHYVQLHLSGVGNASPTRIYQVQVRGAQFNTGVNE